VFEQMAALFVYVLSLYLLVGIVFAGAFVYVGVTRIDPEAVGTGVAFRALIFPGSVAFWPMLLRRWIAGKSEPPPERNHHR